MADVRNQNTPPQNTKQPSRDTGTSTAIAPARRNELQRSYGSTSPFSFMRRFMSDMDRLFGDFGFSGLTPFGARFGEGLASAAAWGHRPWPNHGPTI